MGSFYKTFSCIVLVSLVIDMSFAAKLLDSGMITITKDMQEYNPKRSLEQHVNVILQLGTNEGLKVVKAGNGIKKMQETYCNGQISVYSNMITAEMSRSDHINYITGVLLTEISEDIDCEAEFIDKETAISNAKQHAIKEGITRNFPQIKGGANVFVDYINSEERDNLENDTKVKAIFIYLVNLVLFGGKANGAPLNEYKYKINALEGTVIDYWNSTKTYDLNATGGNERTGKHFFDGTMFPPLKVEKHGDMCTLRNDECEGHNVAGMFTNDITIEDLIEASTVQPYTFKCDEGLNDTTNGAYSPLADAFGHCSGVMRMYEEWADGDVRAVDTLPVRVYAHYGIDLINAFWFGYLNSMYFGDGHPVNFHPLTTTDIIGHEMAHGFTECNSNLEYRLQSGGNNEAYSDVAGLAYQQFALGSFSFFLGESIAKFDGFFIRYICQQDVDGLSITNVNKYNDDLDVHFTSGILNKVHCVLLESGEYSIRDTFRLFTFANAFFWTPTSGFRHAVCGLMFAANKLNLPMKIIAKAADEVGLGIKPCKIYTPARILDNVFFTDLSRQSLIDVRFLIDEIRRDVDKIVVVTFGGKGDVDILTSIPKIKSTNDGNDEKVTIRQKDISSPKRQVWIILHPKGLKYFKHVTMYVRFFYP